MRTRGVIGRRGKKADHGSDATTGLVRSDAVRLGRGRRRAGRGALVRTRLEPDPFRYRVRPSLRSGLWLVAASAPYRSGSPAHVRGPLDHHLGPRRLVERVDQPLYRAPYV